MKTILYNPIFINPQAYYVFPRLTRYLQPDNESTSEPANYIGTIEVKVIAYGDTTLKRTYTNTDSIDLSEFKNTWIRISLFTKVGSCVLGEWKIGNMESDLPYIDPEVLASLKAVVIVGNKTNNDSDRAIVKNLVDPDNPFVISNAAFKLNSGFGKYETELSNTRIWTQSKETTSSPFSSNYNGLSGWIIFANTELTNSVDIPSIKIEVKGLLEGQELIYRYYDSTGQTNVYSMTKDGEYTLPADVRTAKPLTSNTSGFQIVKNETNTITITQIPSFEGAFVTDGIDDLITSTKTVQEMLGGSNEITVVSMIHQVKDSSNNVSFTNYIRGSANGYFRNIVNNYDKTGIYGYTSSDLMALSVVNNILGDKNDYTSNVDNRDSIINGNFSVQGYSYNDGNNTGDFSSVAWYWTIIANKVLTTDQINQVIAYFNLDRTLKSDIYCNIAKQGITNENHAEFGDKLIDFSGNGRDIQLNNLAWKGDSGIGKYEVDFLDSSIWDSSNSTITSSKIDCKNAISHIMLLYYSVGSKEYPDIPSFKVIKTGADIDYSYIDETGSPKSVRIVDGVNVLPASHNTLYSGSGRFCGFGNPGMGNSVTITQIPSHAGGLCLDGVNDFGKVTGLPIYKDYTVIADYERTDIGNIEGIGTSPVLSKSYTAGQGSFIMNFIASTGNSVRSYSFGTENTSNFNDLARQIFYQSKYKNQGFDITAGTGVDGDSLWLGTARDNDSRFFNGAIYSLMSFPYSMSEFLIERQLKKHKLGTLYPDMVEFRPVIKSNVLLDAKPTFVIRGTSTYLNAGDYVPENSQIWVSIKMNNIADRITKFTVNGKTIDIPENAYSEVTLQYGFPFVIDKSPQKISITIEQDENYVLFNPVINSNYDNYKLTFHLREYEKLINIGDYIPKGTYIRANLYLKNDIDELVTFTFNGVNIDYAKSPVLDTAYNIRQIYNYDFPQEVNITIDEYIRFEDIVQPYPVLLRFKDENGNEVSWGGKFKVGSTITRIGSIDDPERNLLNGLYSVSGLSLNGKAVTSSTSIVEKQMVFKTTTTYLLDNNEPKCILSPSRLRIPNSSYKLLGYIPDISGHGNHGVIHNSAYAEGSGVNEDGSYQFDGVDDFVTIPTLSSGGKQVLMKVNWNTINSIIYDQRGSGGFAIYCSDYNNPSDSITVPAYKGRNAAGTTYIDGIRNEYIIASQLRNVTHNIVEILDTSYAAGNINPIIGKLYANYNYGSLALYDFMLFDNISTDDKIKELNEYVGIEAKVELPPYYWDAYGKSNLDEDRDSIKQRGVAVGDYDITNYNHAYDKMSGYGGYAFAKFDNTTEWTTRNREDGIEIIKRNGYSFTAKRIGTGQYFYDFQNRSTTVLNKSLTVKAVSNNNTYIRWEYKYRTAEKPDVDSTLLLVRQAMTPNVPITVTLPYKTEQEKADLGVTEGSDSYLFYFDPSDIPVGDEYTVEMLPLYTNGLVYDGIADYSKNANIPALDDFTAIIKREFLKKQGSPLIKGSKVYEGGNGNALLLEWDKAYNFVFYKRTDIMEGELPDNISFITPTNYNGNVITRGSEQDTNGICIAGDGNAGFANMVFYKLILYPKTIPLLQINFLKNLMERDEIIDLTNPIFIQE